MTSPGYTANYAYDSLNRLTSKTYSDSSTPPASFFYDQSSVALGSWASPTLTNPKGRLSYTCTSPQAGSCTSLSTATVYSYDAAGRVRDLWQCTPYNCGTASIWNLHYNYDLAGDITSWQHPAGFTITNSINNAGQISQIASSLNDSTHPGTLATLTYTAFGGLSTLVNGCAGTGCTQRQETYYYNNRLQPVSIQLGTSASPTANYCLVYNYYSGVANSSLSCANSFVPPAQTGSNNGNVRGYLYQDTSNPSLGHTASYTYDALNRLATAVATGSSSYNLTFEQGIGTTSYQGYDRYGNMKCVANGSTNGPCPQWSFNAAKNQINSSGFSYDAAGNLTADASLSPVHTYQWDAEGRMKSIDNGSTASQRYNALGQKVDYTNGGFQGELVYDLAGRSLGQYDAHGASWDVELVPFGNRVIATEGGNESVFMHANQVESTTVVTSYSGSVLQDQLFYPWGQQWANQESQYELHFGALTITDLGNYLAQFRLHSPNQGRWLTPDPLAGNVLNPQSLNRYAYVGNNPTTLTDPLGLDDCAKADDPRACRLENYWGLGDSIIPSFGAWDDPFRWIGVPVVSESFGSPELISTIDFGAMGNNNGQAVSVSILTESGYTYTYVGDAFQIASCFGGDALCARDGRIVSRVNGAVHAESGDFLTGLAVGGAVGAAEGLAGSSVSTAADTTILYRAVSQGELDDILSTGAYNPSPFGGEVKYFYPTAEQAQQFVNLGMADGVTSVEVPVSLVNSSYTGVVAGEGQIIAIPKDALSGLGPINVLPPH